MLSTLFFILVAPRTLSRVADITAHQTTEAVLINPNGDPDLRLAVPGV